MFMGLDYGGYIEQQLLVVRVITFDLDSEWQLETGNENEEPSAYRK